MAWVGVDEGGGIDDGGGGVEAGGESRRRLVGGGLMSGMVSLGLRVRERGRSKNMWLSRLWCMDPQFGFDREVSGSRVDIEDSTS